MGICNETRDLHYAHRSIRTKFAKCMSLHQWKVLLKDCLEYVLSSPVADTEPPYDMLAIRLRLLQLTEACHLPDVRFITQPLNTGV
jgi:hypothetical protein